MNRIVKIKGTKTRLTGFTLIELMITVALCALVVTLTVVNVSFLNRGIVRSELNRLYSTCNYLRQCALASGKVQVLDIDFNKGCYSFDGKTEKLNTPVLFGVVPDVKGPPSSPQSMIRSSVTFKKNQIVFYPDGIISSGTVYLTDRDRTSFYALSSGIAQVSHLRKYSYNGKWMLLP